MGEGETLVDPLLKLCLSSRTNKSIKYVHPLMFVELPALSLRSPF